MLHHFPILFESIPDETLRWEKLFFWENTQFIAQEELVKHFQLEKYVLLIHPLFTKRGF